jgi:hypothetical protein
MNPHSNPNIIQPAKIPVQSGLFEGCIFRRMEIPVTIRNAHAAQIQKVNKSIKMVNIQNQKIIIIYKIKLSQKKIYLK